VSLDKVLWQATIVAVAVSSVMGEDAWMVAVVGIIQVYSPFVVGFLSGIWSYTIWLSAIFSENKYSILAYTIWLYSIGSWFGE
jgi:hypothetical protein